MTRRLDFGVCSYRNPEKLAACLASIAAYSTTDWRCLIVHNPSGDEEGSKAGDVAAKFARLDDRVSVEYLQSNIGYAGAVNRIAERAETPYFAYLDNDTEILTPGWDERLCAVMDLSQKIGQVFPGAGHYGFHNGLYHECLWNAGYAWVQRKGAVEKESEFWQQDYPGTIQPSFMDEHLGHHEEVDWMIRLRLAGYLIACDPGVNILHHQTATSSPESQKRIHAGVVRWMNKWNRYFCGEVFKYPDPDQEFDPTTGHFASGEGYDPLALRYTDWPPCALYLERWILAQFPDWNQSPRVVQTTAGKMDVIEILKPTGCYKGRAI